MLYCKKCGNAVNEGDRFCESCMSHLNIQGNVLSVLEKAHGKNDGEFTPELAATQNDFLGLKIFGYRIIEELERDFDTRFFRGIGDEEERIIHYILFPSPELYSQVYIESGFNKAKTDDFFSNAIQEYKKACPIIVQKQKLPVLLPSWKTMK